MQGLEHMLAVLGVATVGWTAPERIAQAQPGTPCAPSFILMAAPAARPQPQPQVRPRGDRPREVERRRPPCFHRIGG